jgi:phenylpropionate dioxygenase-like ring-hydroxylating dioxygenase large terminal subunit
VTDTLPYRWYTDPDVLRLEQERIFARSWQYAGRAEEVAEPGSYVAARSGDVPLVVTRARDGELRAFVNVCRHRGHVLVDGAGRRETIQCPYHAWTYELDGTLRKAPRSEREQSFEPDRLGLRRASAATWGPFLFVNPDAGAAPLEETLGDLPRILERAVDLSRLRFHSRAEYDLRANWKIAVENYLECYHCPTAHQSFSAQVDVHPDAYVLEPHGTFASQHCHTRGDPSALGQFHLVYPGLKVNVYPGRTNLSLGPVFPDGPERTTGFLDYFFGDDVDTVWIDELLALDDQVGREDTALVEGVHKGVRSGLVEHGSLLLESEGLIHEFQRWVDRALA